MACPGTIGPEHSLSNTGNPAKEPVDEDGWLEACRDDLAKAELLQTNPLFEGLSQEERLSLAEMTRALRFGPGEVVTVQSDRGDCLYQVVSGCVEVERGVARESEQREVARLGAGTVFGKMTLFTDAPGNATVSSLEETVLQGVERRDRMPLAEANPGLLATLTALIAKRQVELDKLHGDREAPEARWMTQTMLKIFG